MKGGVEVIWALCVACLALGGISLAVAADPEQVCKTDSIWASTPTAEFVDNGDGTVTHRRTGLTWMRCSLGQIWDGKGCNGEAKGHLWKQALQAAADLNASGGYAKRADWRVPNIKELDSIAELQCAWPAINLTIFPGTPPKRFWSSSLFMQKNFRWAMFVSFQDGYTDDGRVGDPDRAEEAVLKFSYPVRLVRGGDDFDSLNQRR